MKLIELDEFMDAGYLQEVNRRFFHPLGLALMVAADTDDETGEVTSDWRIEGIIDVRDDPEGMIFEEVDPEKVERIEQEETRRRPAREAALGYWIQPKG